MIRIRSPQDFAAGLLFMGLAAFALWIARDYPIGTAVRMSSGYFPRLLCFLLLAIGVFVTLRALKCDGPAITHVRFRPLVLVTASIVVFAYAIQTVGVVIATVLLVLIGGYASPRVRLVEMAAAAVVLARDLHLGHRPADPGLAGTLTWTCYPTSRSAWARRCSRSMSASR